MSLRRWTAPLLWAAAVLTISSIPSSELPSIDDGDKLAHVAMYAVLGWLTIRAAWRPEASWWTVGLVILALSAFGAFDEWHQRFIPGRSPDVGDWVADTAGVALGSVLAAVLLIRRWEQAA